MTEVEWFNSSDPQDMLRYLRDNSSERKFRLFSLACCRRVDRLITDPRSRAALDFVDRHVEMSLARRKGKASLERAARAAHKTAYNNMFSFPPGPERARCLILSNALDAAAQTLNTQPFYAASYAASFSSFALGWEGQVASGVDSYPDLRDTFTHTERIEQTRLLRELFGNPFRSVAITPYWLSWNDGTLARLAQAIYDERLFPDGTLDSARLAILADALEDAGCTDSAILEHLRGPGPHVRGCWVVDLLLEKK